MVSEVVRQRAGAFDIHPASADVAIPVADGIWMSPGLSNSFCVANSAGRVVINTGMGFEAGHHKRLYDAVAPVPTRYILLTQAHVDHVGGVDHFRESETQLIAQANNPACQADDERIHRFRVKRSMPYWAEAVSKADRFIKSQPPDAPIPGQSVPTPDVLYVDEYTFELGDLCFELISTPGGETVDSTVIWLPDRRIAFVGNVFSALFGHVPNLVTLRADRLRYALPFVAAVQRVIDLDAEVLCVGHGDPLVGASTIRSQLERLRDGVQWLHDAVVEGMNANRSVYDLMREVRLPDNVSLGEGYGKVAWDVRAIWEGYAGWFHARATSELYPLEPTAASAELVELAGGVGVVVHAVERHLADANPQRALALIEHATAAAPTDAEVLRASISVHEALFAEHVAEHPDDFTNFWLVGWLRHQIATMQRSLTEVAP